MWGGGKARFLSAAECFPLARGRPNRRGGPPCWGAAHPRSVRGTAGVLPTAVLPRPPSWPGPGSGKGLGLAILLPSSVWLRLPAPPPPGYCLSSLSRKEPGWKFPFSNPIFTRGVNQMSPLLKTPKCKATKWYSKFRSRATLGQRS